MIATISFGAMAEWVIGAYVAGCLSGFWFAVLAFKKRK